MSDVQDPLQETEKVTQEPAPPAPDKKIVFGARKPTEEVSAVIGIPAIIEAPFPFERTLQWLPDGVVPAGFDEPTIGFPGQTAGEPAPHDPNNKGSSEVPAVLESDGNTSVIVSQEVLLKVNQHVAQSLEHELGGFLLGNRYRCPSTSRDYVIIDQYSPAKFTESNEIRLAFTHEAWAQLSDELSGKFLGKLLIGWYHSHPRMDVFLSNHDMEIQNERFSESWNVALVLEPEKHRGGFFCARDGRVKPHTPVDFFELLERNSRNSVLAWENYAALDPSTSAAPVLSETNTSTLSTAQPEETPVTPKSAGKKAPVKGKRRGRFFFIFGFVILLGGLAVGIANRTKLRTWLQNRTAAFAEVPPVALPTPTVEPTSTPQVQPVSVQEPSAPSPSPSVAGQTSEQQQTEPTSQPVTSPTPPPATISPNVAVQPKAQAPKSKPGTAKTAPLKRPTPKRTPKPKQPLVN